MRHLMTVFKFELREMVLKKSYLITLAILCILAFLAVSLPTIFNFFSKDSAITDIIDIPDISEPNIDYLEDYNTSNMGFVFLDESYDIEKFQMILGNDELIIFSKESELKEAIINEEIKKGIIINSYTSYKYVVNDKSMYDFTQSQIEAIMRQIVFEKNLATKGIDPLDVEQAMTIYLSSDFEQLGKDSASGYTFAYIFMFVLYLLVLLFGQTVTVSVAREKDNRTMELLITSTNPKVLIVGKVLAAGLAGVIQISAIILAVVIGFFLNKGNYPSFILDMLSSTLSLPVLLVYLLFSFLGYVLYLFIFAALGSLVSKVEDVNSSITPVMLIFIVAYLIANVALNAPDLKIVAISSYIPFLSLFTMPIRYMLTSISFFEVIISALLLIVTTYGIALLSIYIYRLGSLNYGNKMKLRDIVKSFKRKPY